VKLNSSLPGFSPLKKAVLLLAWLSVCGLAGPAYGDTTDVINTVGPGVRYHHVTITEGPQEINCLEITWPNSRIALKSVLGAGGENGRPESTSDIVRRYRAAGYRVIGAVNGDYYYLKHTGIPTNLHIQDSQLAVEPIRRSALVITDQKKLAIDVFRFRGQVITGTGRILHLDGYNRVRASNELILYNQYRGESTRTNGWGAEIVLRPLRRWLVNDTIPCLVKAKYRKAGNAPIPRDGAVLSGHGAAATFLQKSVDNGDTLKLVLKITPEYGHVVQAIGGGPRILQNGRVSVDKTTSESMMNHRFFRHPRTAVGFNKDTTRVFLITVDGRSERSRGMTLAELARFLRRYFRIREALNLDGGGSTTMVLGDQVVNTPSDPEGERPVGNALVIIQPDTLDGLHSLLGIPGRNGPAPFQIFLPDVPGGP